MPQTSKPIPLQAFGNIDCQRDVLYSKSNALQYLFRGVFFNNNPLLSVYKENFWGFFEITSKEGSTCEPIFITLFFFRIAMLSISFPIR